MLKLKNLKTLQKYIKLRPICVENKISYDTVEAKIHKQSELSIEQSENLTKVFQKLKKLIEDNIK